MGDVGPNAQIDHRSATVYSRRRAIGNFRLNKISLVFVILQSLPSEGAEGRAIVVLHSRGTFPVTFSSKREGVRTFADLWWHCQRSSQGRDSLRA